MVERRVQGFGSKQWGHWVDDSGQTGAQGPTGPTGPTGPADVATFVYRPGGVQTGNVYNNFPDLVTALQNQEGPKWVEVDDSIVAIPLIPAGVFDVNGAIFQGLPGADQTLLRGSVGSQLQNLGGLSTQLQLQCNDAALPLYVLSVNEILNIEDGASIASLVAAPAVSYVAAGTAAIRLQAAEIADIGLGPGVAATGGVGSSLRLFVYEGSVIGEDTIVSSVGTIVTFDIRDFGARVSRTQTGALGTEVYTDIFATSNAVPDVDDAYDNGDLDARWRVQWSRIAISTEQAGAGATDLVYGVNSIGRIVGASQAVPASTARQRLSDPVSMIDSPVEVAANVRADLAGGTAEAFASGAGASVRGNVRAITAHTASLLASGVGSFASGDSVANGFAGTIEATAQGSHALGSVEAYPGAGYGATTVRASGRGSMAQGLALYSGTVQATALGSMARGTAAGGPFVQDAAGVIEATESGAFASGDATGGSIEAGGVGSFASGSVRQNSVPGGTPPRIFAEGPGTMAFGRAVDPNALITTGTGGGSLAFGLALTYANTSTARIETGAQGGAFAGGLASAEATRTANIAALENGAIAFGAAFAENVGGANATIIANQEGAVALGVAINADILASAEGAMALGFAEDSDITASGQGSFAQGRSSAGAGSIVASAQNAVQLGPGTNSVAESVRIGGAGLHFKGTSGAFGAGSTGQFWIDGGNVYVWSGGAARNMTNIP